MANSPTKNSKPSTEHTIGLPVLLEVIFTLSKLTVVLVGIIVMVVTFANGNPYWVAMLRGGVTVLSLGLIVWFISWFFSKGVIESVKNMLQDADNTAISGNNMDKNV